MAIHGIVGLGLVGNALASRLIEFGHPVVGFDIDPRRCDELKMLGGSPLASAKDVAHRADQCLLSLPTSDIVAGVLDEMNEHLRGKTVIDTTTGDPEASMTVGRRLAEEQIQYLDATIVGSSKHVRSGEAFLLIGGDESAFHAAESMLKCVAKECFYLGTWGSGARMKLVVNLVIGLHRAVLAEALSFAMASGVDQETALRVMQASLAYSRVMDTKGRKMIEGDYAVEARLAQHHKDVRLILELARRAETRLPLSELHSQLLSKAESRGFGEADNSAIIEAYRG